MITGNKYITSTENFHKSIYNPVVVKVTEFNEAGAKKFAENFEEALESPQDVIPIIIDSYGGQVYSLLGMIDIIKTSHKPVHTIVSGKAMSCGSVLFSVGTKRFMGPTATLMIHEVSIGDWGKITEFNATAAEANRLNDTIYSFIDEAIKKPGYIKGRVHENGHADIFLDAKEAKTLGLCTDIGLPKFKLEAKIDWKFE